MGAFKTESPRWVPGRFPFQKLARDSHGQPILQTTVLGDLDSFPNLVFCDFRGINNLPSLFPRPLQPGSESKIKVMIIEQNLHLHSPFSKPNYCSRCQVPSCLIHRVSGEVRVGWRETLGASFLLPQLPPPAECTEVLPLPKCTLSS